LTARGTADLERSRTHHPWAREGATTVVRADDRRERWWTFAGLVANADLAARLGATDFDSLQIRLPAPVTGLDPRGVVAASEKPVTLWDRLAADLKFAECLPTGLRRQAASRRMTDDAAVSDVIAEPLDTVQTQA